MADTFAVNAFQVTGAVFCAVGVLTILIYMIDEYSVLAVRLGWTVVGLLTWMIFFAILIASGF